MGNLGQSSVYTQSLALSFHNITEANLEPTVRWGLLGPGMPALAHCYDNWQDQGAYEEPER